LPRFLRRALELHRRGPYDAPVTFRAVLTAEFDRRRRANSRYSLRSFARDLSIDHSTLSQILRGKRRITGRSLRAMGRRLRLTAPQIAELCALENEAAVLATLDRPNFKADSRWVAMMAGIPIDDVNVTLQRLLRKRIVTMQEARWEIR
jgi:transcriptional regulator with XRE-family HTH domain